MLTLKNKPYRSALLCTVCLLALTACGQTGPLVLPSPAPETTADCLR